ncbi:MAG: MDR family MFS transporter [Dehalococcoidia bacterium]
MMSETLATTNRARLIIMSGVMLGLLLSALDQTIVSTAMPRIIADLGGLSFYSWVFTAYLLTSTAAVPIFGKLSDLYGRKPFYMGGITLFLITSGLCGIAQSMPMLIVLRGLQGIGGGIMMANAFAIIGDIFPPAERGKWQGLTSSVFGLASVLGPFIGGFLTDNLSWRWVFYVNLPIGAVALFVLSVVLPSIQSSGRRYAIDYLGVAGLLATVVPLLLTFVWAGDLFAWFSAPFFALLALALVSGAAFIWIERHAQEPILPMYLFRNPIFTSAALIMFLSGMAMFGATVYMPLYMVAVRGASATSAGLATMPMTLAMVVASTSAGQIVSRSGRYKALVITGAVIMVSGMGLLALMTINTSTPAVYRNMVVVGVGIGLLMPILTIVVQNALPYKVLGTVTSSVQFFRSIGQTVGVAIFGSILTTRLAVEIPNRFSTNIADRLSPAAFAMARDPKSWLSPILPPQLGRELLHPADGGAPAFGLVQNALRGAFSASLHDVFLIGASLGVIAVLGTLTLKEIPLRKSYADEVKLSSHAEGAFAEPEFGALALSGEDGGQG